MYFRPTGYIKPLAILNIFGGNIGGPIKKDKLFYFVNVERTTERTGYFSSLFGGSRRIFAPAISATGPASTTVYDPASRTAGQRRRAHRFPGNIVSGRTGSIPIFPNIYKDMPLPNQVSPTDPLNLSGNYGVSGLLRLNRNQYDTKINYNVSQQRWPSGVSTAAWIRRWKVSIPSAIWAAPRWAPPAREKPPLSSPPAASTRPFSPTFIVDGVFGYTRMDQFVGIPNVRQERRSRHLEDPRHQRWQAVCERHSLRRRTESDGFRFH